MGSCRTLRAFGRRYQNRKRLHYKFTVSQLFDLLRTEPDRYKRCLLDVKWWHTAEAILKQPENGLTKILLPSKNSIGHAFDKDEVVVQISNPVRCVLIFFCKFLELTALSRRLRSQTKKRTSHWV